MGETSEHFGDKAGFDWGDVFGLNSVFNKPKPEPKYRDEKTNEKIPAKITSQGDRTAALSYIYGKDVDKTSDKYLSLTAGLNEQDRSRGTKPGSTGMADIARNSGLPSGKEAAAISGGQGFGSGATPEEAGKVTAIERVEDSKPKQGKDSGAAKPGGGTRGDALARIFNQNRAPKPQAPRDEAPDYMGIYDKYATEVKGLAIPQKQPVDYTKGAVSHEREINEAFEGMKALAHTDPGAYKKEFMKDNYKGHQAVSDILSGARQALTGQGGGQTNADRVNALLSEKMNALRDKNREARTQLGLKHQESLLGERARFGDALAAAGVKTEEAANEAAYANEQSRFNQDKELFAGGRDAALKYADAVTAAANKQAGQNWQIDSTLYLAGEAGAQALRNRLNEMEAMRQMKQEDAARYMDIYKNQGREAMYAAVSADQGIFSQPGALSRWYMQFMDGFDSATGRR